MGLEIERKFLIDKTLWEQLPKSPGKLYRQGYLTNDPGKTIRVRQTATTSYLTIKGRNVGAVRPEFEYEIPGEDATELLDKFSHSEISKIRYEIKVGNHTWEVDEFLGENTGLIVAEIELLSEDESFELPAWIGKEVTADNKYYNSQLAAYPYASW
ncbi:MAG: CYTH domain-containing protein [Chitinophagaceae bacterium]|nr:MAG: CYTH domain-containing protein [Chitinophagaceae bacterium]